MKVCVCTIANYAYLPGAEALFYSLKRTGKYETVLLSSEVKECRFADRVINYDKDIFKPLRTLPTKLRLQWSWGKLMIWKFLLDYDRVIFMDSDIIILNEIKELYTDKYKPYDFAAFKLYSASGGFLYGSGTMVINKSILKANVYDEMFDMAFNYEKYGMEGLRNGEESVINFWLTHNKVKCFDMDFGSWFASDCEMPRIKVKVAERDDISDMKLLHYVQNKPWTHPKEPASRLFNECYVEMSVKDLKNRGLM